MNTARLDALQQFLKQDPRDPFNHYAIALEYVSMKNFPEAVSKFKALLEIDANYVPAYHQLGLLFIQLERNEEAIKTLKAGIGVAGRNGDTHAQSEMQETLDELAE